MNELAEAVRLACLSAALRTYEDAGVQGLRADVRWEAAVSAMQTLDLRRIVEETRRPGDHAV